jgi:signal transduction histidine kinase
MSCASAVLGGHARLAQRLDREALENNGTEVCLAVSNPGASIDNRYLTHVFDRFYRADSARRNSVENHGLALAIVKAIATMHRGSVFARSEGGRNTFGFTLACQGEKG